MATFVLQAALADLEALQRPGLPGRPGSHPFEFLFHEMPPAPGHHRIRTSARDKVLAIKDLIPMAAHAAHRLVQGVLAGIFDAEGSNGGVIRIAKHCGRDHRLDPLLP